MPTTPQRLFQWHERPGAFVRLAPPWQQVRLIQAPSSLGGGALAELAVKIGPIWKRWTARHENYVPGVEFTDVQIRGPFATWSHRHLVGPAEGDTATLTDEVTYAPPLGPIGRLLMGRQLRKDLAQVFTYRHETTRQDLTRHAATEGSSPMKILVTGATGMVGSQLTAFLQGGGHTVYRLTRSEPAADTDIQWDPQNGTLDAAKLEGFDAVVHLAGENVGEGRWTEAKKARIRDSRIDGTSLLVRTLARLERKPKVLVAASAIGFYGDRGDEPLTEESAPGEGFLSEVCVAWERATRDAATAGIRVVNLRFGVILSGSGGALKKMLLPFKMGMGGKLGSGEQMMSWIGLDDAVGVIHHALLAEDLAGPVNAVAPEPVTNKTFTKTLGRVLWRPTIVPMPGFMARAAFGEMADALLLASARVLPKRLQETGYVFATPSLEDCLRRQLGKVEVQAAEVAA
ncbi:MAG: TIGR01777 family oxidoreductase [Planctomycetota bacterium]|nr:TIGR01777 family oxidoreductase [Planctomycetota bacterium]